MASCPSIPDLLRGLLGGDVLGLLPEPIGTLSLACFKAHVSLVLGYAIVTGSSLVKLPQLLKILQAKSVAGLAMTTMLMEMCASISSFSYYIALGYPFSTWGENFFLFFQNIGLTVLFFHYTSGVGSAKALATAVLGTLLGVVLYGRMLPDVVLPAPVCSTLGLSRCTVTCEDVAGSLPTVLMLVGRLPQIMQNFRQRHAGQLALITYLLNTLGGFARIFTTLQTLNDPITLFSVVSLAALEPRASSQPPHLPL